jgi:hypothetical protein
MLQLMEGHSQMLLTSWQAMAPLSLVIFLIMKTIVILLLHNEIFPLSFKVVSHEFEMIHKISWNS